MRVYRVVYIPGDGVGPEIMRYAKELLERLGIVEFVEYEAGRGYYEKTGRPYDEELLDAVRKIGIVLKGPLETPKISGYRSVTYMLRRVLGIYADIRRFKTPKRLNTPRLDLTIVREAAEGIYVGAETIVGDVAIALKVLSRHAAQRISRLAFRLAVGAGYRRVYAVHKATIIRSVDGLFLQEFYRVSKEYEGRVEAADMLVDSAAYIMARNPEKLNMIVTLNQYGDILSDLAAGVAGSIGLYASKQIGEYGALFEPVHGTGYDIAGKNIANPISAFRAAQYLAEYLAERYRDEYAACIAQILDSTLDELLAKEGVGTPDIGGSMSTSSLAELIIETVLRRVDYAC